jgi:small GTP-binding protein
LVAAEYQRIAGGGADIEAEIARTQKNKATNSHLGLLRAKLSKLKSEVVGEANKKAGGGGEGFDVAKTGDSRVGLIGFPSVGKSTLLTKLTGTESEAASYEFTTLTCVPGTFRHKGAKVQLLDLPGIIEGAKEGKGRGKQVIAVALTCSLLCIVLDIMKPLTHRRIIEKELEGFGIRLNKKRPEIMFKKKDKGGMAISVSPGYKLKGLDEETICAICKEYKIANATISFRCNATADDLIDVIEGNRRYVPGLYILNKVDQVTLEELDIISQLPNSVCVSAHKEWNLDGCIDRMWEMMDFVRVYTKPKGAIPDYNAPVILPRDRCKVEDLCGRLHRDLIKSFKNALVWGQSTKHNPQRVGRDHTLCDEDVIQIIKKA